MKVHGDNSLTLLKVLVRVSCIMWLSSAYFVKYNEKNEKGLAFLGDLHFFYTGREKLMRSEFEAHGAAWNFGRGVNSVVNYRVYGSL